MTDINENMTENVLQEEKATYERLKPDLFAHHLGKFIVIHKGELVGTFDTFQVAAQVAVANFGVGPYLIRQVIEQEPIPMPASVAYRPAYAAHR